MAAAAQSSSSMPLGHHHYLHLNAGHRSSKFQASFGCLPLRRNQRFSTGSAVLPRDLSSISVEEANSLPTITRTRRIKCQSSLTKTSSVSTSTHNDTTTLTRRPRDDETAQELSVYEFNEGDRDSPALLHFGKLAVDWQKPKLVGGLGDFVLFTNKLYDGSLKKRLGITAGFCMIMRCNSKKAGFLFEATYSFYFGDFGHISVQGPYTTYEETVLTVTGGTGFFTGVYGTVTVNNVKFPTILFYTFKLYGIPELPAELIWDTVSPSKDVKPSPDASSPGVALPNFTN